MAARVDETGAPWPYEAHEPPAGVASPTWECPGGSCVCHAPSGEVARAKHRIVLHDQGAARMPGARCRVGENGRLLNMSSPFAGADGAIDVEPAQSTRTLFVEWAPGDTPSGARYPFRKLYWVRHSKVVEHGVRTRLDNLGFCAYSTLRENVRDFQRTYLMKETGRASDVDTVLRRFHDDGLLPPIPANLHARSPDESMLAAPDDPAPPPGQPGPTPPQGALTGIQTTKLRIELVRAFALFEEDFDKDDDVLIPDWEGEQSDDGEHNYGTYDAHRLLNKLYPTAAQRLNRWAAGGVSKATVTVSDGTGEPVADGETDVNGVVVFDIPVVPTTSALIIDVAPPDGQFNESRMPAGPELTNEKTTAPFMYRPFALLLNLDASGAVVTTDIAIQPSDRPRFAKVIDAAPGSVKVDWRPDWISAGKKKSRFERILDPDDTPLNAFDLSVDVEERRAKSPPAILIHATATHNFPAIIAHLQDDQVIGSHYWVDFDGFVVKEVDEFYKTNHAGESLWRRKGSANQFSVGIETMHMDTVRPQTKKEPSPPWSPRRYTKEQYAALIRLCRELQAAYPILRGNVIGHTDQFIRGAAEKAPGKQPVITDGTHKFRGCPGDYFDWQRLEQARVALSPFFPWNDLPDWDIHKEAHEAVKDLYWDMNEIPQRTKGKSTKSEKLRRIKVMLHDIGYSVATTRIARDAITNEFDEATIQAVRAFQQHHFSGRRRRYRGLSGTKGKESSWPMAGTLDVFSVRAIVETWWAVQQDT